VFLMLGRLWGNDPDVQQYRAMQAWHARCDQYRDVTRREKNQLVIAAAEQCQAEAERLVSTK